MSSSPQRDHTVGVHQILSVERAKGQARTKQAQLVFQCNERVEHLERETANATAQQQTFEDRYVASCKIGAMMEATKHAESARRWEETKNQNATALSNSKVQLDQAKEDLANMEE